MYLKQYQERVVNELKYFLETAHQKRKEVEEQEKELEKVDKKLRKELLGKLDYVKKTLTSLGKVQLDSCRDGLGRSYPRVTLKVPTGGGKTLLAVEAIKTYQSLFARKSTGLVVWVVPKEVIYTQTIKHLRDRTHFYRQLLDQLSGGHTIIKEKGETLSQQDVEENLVILFIMIQSVSRNKSREALKVFQDSGGYEDFFPQDNRHDLHGQLLKEISNLDAIWHKGEQAQLITSLGNAIRVCRPFIIIDEIHRVFTENAKNTIDNLNPEMVLGLSATPQKGMDILSKVSGLELKNEEMIKLDMHIYPPPRPDENDWREMIRQLKARREHLEKTAKAYHVDPLENEANEYRNSAGEYIRPIALIQVERTGKDQRGKGLVHSEDVKEYLVQMGVNVDYIAIKSASKDDISNINLLSRDCPIRYIITKEALKEGWDCPFAYILGIIPHTRSNRSVTQLIGRILRQPRAKKTGIPALDESYVYYTKGDSGDLLEAVKTGFKQEGIEDLMGSVKESDPREESPPKTVGIKEKFKKYNYAFYLPVWLMIQEDQQPRKFNYHTDIRAHLSFRDFILDDSQLGRIKNSLSAERKEDAKKIVGLSEDSKVIFQGGSERKVVLPISKIEMIKDLTRHYTEVIENAFLARQLASTAVDTLIADVGEDALAIHFGHIASLLSKELQTRSEQKEEALFAEHLDKKHLVLGVSNDSKIGYKIPEIDIVNVSEKRNLYKSYLYEDVDADTLNSLEQTVADILEKKEKLLWWFRNKVAKGWYAIQGWREYKIRPDFVVAKRNGTDAIEVVYILESKGDHLKGNPDSVYKKKVMDRMTDLKTQEIKAQQIEIGYGQLNTSVEAHFVEEDKKEEQIGALMK